MKDALSIHRLLLERQTTHEIVRLRRPITSADELPEVLDLPAKRCFCTRLYVHQGSELLTAVIVTAGCHPPTSAVASALGVHAVCPAPADLINRATDYAADLVAPLMLPEDITMLVDQRAASVDDIVYTATGEACTALGIHTLDLFELCDAKPAPIPPSKPEADE
jgi:prolyl-tRNA editing enzyme YbaK/EbsC (Cys-tRNA(Pro) deacylase)